MSNFDRFSLTAPAARADHSDGHRLLGSQFVCTAANLSLADHLSDGPAIRRRAGGRTGANPRALHRFMRTLASLGILTHDTATASPLRHWARAEERRPRIGARSTVLAMGGPGCGRRLTTSSTGRNRQNGDGESLRHAALRLSGAACKTPRSSVRRWSASMAGSRRLLPPPMTSPRLAPLSMSGAPPATCWRTSSAGTLSPRASSSIARMS